LGESVSRRARAIAFLLLALLSAALAAGIANGYGARVAEGYGPLRSVVVAARSLRAGAILGPADLATALTLRRVPASFVPPTALDVATDALGLAPAAPIPAGSYLLAAQLRPPHSGRRPGAALGPSRHPVEITVTGAEALFATGAAPHGSRVDVVVSTEPSGPGPGRTYVAASGVPLLSLGPGADGPGPGGASAATLGLTKAEALRLIAAESYARKLTLLPVG
jgi:Flp pilus assembly protein CpaB